jgi:hypothetical protein
MGIAIASLAAALGGPALAQQQKKSSSNSAKHNACMQEAKRSCVPQCKGNAIQIAYQACMKR